MKIAIISPEIVPVTGGISSYTLNLLIELLKTNEISLICPGQKEIIKNYLSKYIGSQYKDFNIIPTTEKNIREPALRTYYHQIGLRKSLSLLERNNKPDLIHFTSAHASGLGWFFSRRLPYVMTVHSLINDDINSLRLEKRDFRRFTDNTKNVFLPILKWNEKMVLKNSNFIIGVTQELVSKIKASYPRNSVRFVANGVLVDLFKPMKEDDNNKIKINNRILFVSRLMPSKGIDIALESCRLLVRSNLKDFEFVFAGEGSIDQYKERCKLMGISQYCRFLGNVDYLDIPQLYHSAFVFCCPSYQESMPMSLLEAMSSGLPCVASRVGYIPQIIKNGHNGIIVEPGNPVELSEQIRRLIYNPKEANLMGINARKCIEESYSSLIMATKTIEIYKEAIAS